MAPGARALALPRLMRGRYLSLLLRMINATWPHQDHLLLNLGVGGAGLTPSLRPRLTAASLARSPDPPNYSVLRPMHQDGRTPPNVALHGMATTGSSLEILTWFW